MEPEHYAEHSGRKERSGFPLALAAGAGIVAFLVAGVVLVGHFTHPRGPDAATHLPFGPIEQAYAANIHFQDLRMSRATNLLNQEFTYLNGTISNDGSRTVRALEVTVEFHDPFNQVILRDTERVIAPEEQLLAAGQQRPFQIIFEHIPAEWNWQLPDVHVTGLELDSGGQ